MQLQRSHSRGSSDCENGEVRKIIEGKELLSSIEIVSNTGDTVLPRTLQLSHIRYSIYIIYNRYSQVSY